VNLEDINMKINQLIANNINCLDAFLPEDQASLPSGSWNMIQG
jgi:hypothetical protein